MASINPSYLDCKNSPHVSGKTDNHCRLTITKITQTNGATNQTTVDWKITVEGTPYSYLHALYVSLGGKVLYDHHTGGAIKTSWNSGDVIASGSTTFNNNTDGSLTLNAYIKQMFFYGNGDTTRWTNPKFYQENSTNMVCSTIPRVSSVSAGSGNIGGSLAINVSRHSSNFTHTLTYAFGNLTGTIATGVGTSYNWTIPTSFYAQIPSANSGVGTITCKTYSGSTLVGTSTCSFTAKVTNSNPTFTSSQLSYLDSNASIVAITGNNQHIVRNKSNLKVTFTDATAKNSASISKYEITFNGNTTNKTAGSTIDYGIVNSSKNLTVSVKAIDTRGNSTTISKTITILDWVLPSAVIKATRVNNYEDETNLKVSVTISSVNNKNGINSIKYHYKKVGASSYSEYVSLKNNEETTVVLDKLFAWDFQVVITDKFGSTTYNFVIAKGTPIMFIDTILQAIGINCFPTEENGLSVSGFSFFDLFPVGAVRMTTNDVNPSKYFKGTWTLLASGKFFSGVDITFYLWSRTS